MKKRYIICSTVLSLFLIIGLSSYTFAEEKPKYGGVLKENAAKSPNRFGVPLNIRHWDIQNADFALEALVTATAEQDVYGPELAVSWDLSSDKSSYVFHLRKGVKFHDGTDFNAQAVKWNIDKVLASTRPVLDKVKSIDIIDDYTVRFNLKEWDALVIADLGGDATFIISPTAFEKNGEEWANTHPVGTGAFKFKKYKRNTYLKFEKNDNYWKEGLPYLDGLTRYAVGDPMTALAMFKRKDIDVFQVDMITGDQLKKEGTCQLEWGDFMHQVMVYNSKDPDSPMADRRVREALEYAIDKETISKQLGKGFTEPLYEVLHSAPGNPKKNIRKYDPEKAKQLLKDAGYPNGLKVKLVHSAMGDSSQYQAIQSYLSAVGVDVKLNPMSMAAFMNQQFTPPQPNSLVSDAQRGGSALRSAKSSLTSNSVFFPGLKRPDGFDDLINQAAMQLDMAKKVSLLEKAEEIAYGDVMFIPLWTSPFVTASQTYVKNYKKFIGTNPKGPFDEVWLDK